MPSLLSVALLALAFSYGAFGAPSCQQDETNAVCVSKCEAETGWPSMGSYNWQQVTYEADENIDDLDNNVCSGSQSSSAITPDFDSTGSLSNGDISAYLSAHNNVRAKHGAKPLTWNNQLSAKALKWAKGCVFKHSGSGENLAAGTGSKYTIASAVKSWTDEVSQYDPRHPKPSHFTQVVWKGTTQVGCAHVDCKGIFDPKFGLAHYHVCEYSPPGNVIGRFPQNVQV